MYRCLVSENYHCNFELSRPFDVRRVKEKGGSVVVIVMKAKIICCQKPLGFISRYVEVWSPGKMHIAMLDKFFEFRKHINHLTA